MRSFFQNKIWTLLLAIVALGALTVLAVGLRDVKFNDAQPLGWHETKPFEIPLRNPVDGIENVSLESLIIFWVIISLLVALIAMLLSPEGRKRMLRILLRMFFTFWFLYYFMRNYGETIAALFNLRSPPADANAQEAASANPPPVFTPPQPSSWISLVVSFLIVISLVYLAWRMMGAWKRFAASHNKEKALDEIAKIARSSLHDLTSGEDSSDVIMKCYFRMSSVVADKRYIRRKDSMTPAEFAERLEHSGLPGDAVRRLTGLFEGVRYGGYRSNSKDINEAVACLTAILNYCGEPV